MPMLNLNLPYSYAKRHGVLLIVLDETITVAHQTQLPNETLIELRRFLQQPFQLKQISPEEFDTLLTQTYESNSDATMQLAAGMSDELDLDHFIQGLPRTEDLLENQDDAPIIRLLNAVFSQAIKQKASDIHLETFEEKLVIRFRIDGILQEILSLQRLLAPLIISRIKVMAKLDIAEKRLPQDGRITLRIAGHTVDVRVSTLPSSHGERVVLRLLDKKVARLDLSLLGMAPETLNAAQRLINHPNGIILVTGPTGSGKTTTLYAMLTKLNQVNRNILTIEDPVEFDLPGIGQTQVNPKINLTFAKGLRAILRQDPDIVMVGEIRDKETVEIAIQSSLTGHLVLSTLHTNSAIGAITRLRDMRIEPFLLSSTLIGVIGQRLVRLLCQHCKEARPITDSERQLLGIPLLHANSYQLAASFAEENSSLDSSVRWNDNEIKANDREINSNDKAIKIYHPIGCSECHHTGYSGRTGIYELVTIDNQLQKLIHENAGEHMLEAYIRGFTPSLRQDGCQRILAGETTLEEVLRVSNEE
jgi:general secretion pathway protein E